jgi:hypothetical protein
MGFWQLGNTSVRSALRIKDGLAALSTSQIQGNIRGKDGDIALRLLLGERGIVSLGEDPTNSVGRKWRAAMGKLGFIYPQVKKIWGFSQHVLGTLDAITPAGWNLIRAETTAAIQECFLRAMATPLDQLNGNQTFSPLCWTLALLLALERRGEEPAVSFLEMARVVQTTTPSDGVDNTVTRILELRKERNEAERKRLFDRDLFARAAKEIGCKPHTFVDYADMNTRYLKATGMVQAKGKGITLVPEKHLLAQQLAATLSSKESLLNLYRTLCNGRALPTDNACVANEVLQDLLQQAPKYGITYSIEGKQLDTPAQINQVRFEIENLIAEKKEEYYAGQQSEQWKEILAYLELIAFKKNTDRVNGDIEINVPRTEVPAYLEWSLWRAFLAINSLSNKPYEVRRFKIDQDFLPISTAPGNGPDLIAEFEDCVIVIEVTLSESSRQEAMEGEPVRRHVADLMVQYNKPVYGLFIANRIDSNTAETFRIGVWYTANDERLDLHIVPLTLAQFSALFKSLFEKQRVNPQTIISILKECERHRKKCEAPVWKSTIAEIVQSRLQ